MTPSEAHREGGRGKAPGSGAEGDDFATALFTGDLFGELAGSLPILTLDLPAPSGAVPAPPTEGGLEPAATPATARSEVVRTPALVGVDAPAFERITLNHDRVRVRLPVRASGEPCEGHVVGASISGIRVEVQDASITDSSESLELILALAGGLEVAFPAKLVRSTETSLSVHYYAGDSTLRFRLRFLDEALHQGDAPPRVELRQRREPADGGAARARLDAETKEIAQLWASVVERFTESEVHQGFLNACIKAGRLDYALERYRVLKRERRDLDVDPYVKQIGTILGFYVLSRSDPEKDGLSRGKKRATILALLFALAIFALLIAQEMVARMAETRTLIDPRSTGSTQSSDLR